MEDEESSDGDGDEHHDEELHDVGDEVVGPNPPNPPQPHTHMAAHMSLEAMLRMPGQDTALPRLSQDEEEGIWFDRDDGLVTKVGKILQDNFDGPYFIWTKLPTEVRDLWFCQLAYEYNWDPVITPAVSWEFDEIIKRRLKGMVSYRRGNRRRPCWITETLWEQMEAEWSTEDAQKRSKTAPDARNSNREGLGIYKHTGGPKSTARIKRDLEKEKGRPVSIGEVFIKAHTGKDGQIVDGKAKKVVEAYNQNIEATQSELSVDPSLASDGASQTSQLTLEQQDALFYKSAVVNDRGEPFGLGSLAKRQSKRQKTFVVPSTSPKMMALEQELKETKALMARQKEEAKNQTDLFIKYLKSKNPELPAWLVQKEAEPEKGIPVDENQLNTTVTTPLPSLNPAT